MNANFSFLSVPLPRKNESGFVLATALFFLVALTILGVGALGVNSLEEKMLGYSRDRQLAFQAADAALRDAERYMMSGAFAGGATNFVTDCTTGAGLYQIRTAGKPIWAELENGSTCKDDAWAGKQSAVNADNGLSFKYGVLSGVGDFKLDTSRVVASQPRFIIEVISVSSLGGSGGSGANGTAGGSLVVGRGPSTSMYVYRVTAVGFGQRLSTRVLLQAVYRP